MMNKIVLALLVSVSGYAQPVADGDTVALGPPTFVPEPIELEVLGFISPNGDGINDILEFALEPNYVAVVKLYSRWGNLVYKSDDYQNDFSPIELADGAYALSIRVYDGSRFADFNKIITIIK